MGLTVYGTVMNRAMRVLWMVEELGVEYEQVPTDFGTGAHIDACRAINPNAKAPAIDDDGFVVWESMAINLYLAKKHGGKLAPNNLEEDALASQWSFWVMTEVERTLLYDVLAPTLGLMGQEKDPAKVVAGIESLQGPFRVLNNALHGFEYLLGDRFTVADLNVASVLIWGKIARLDFGGHANLADWLTRCTSRPAMAKVRG